MPAHTADGTPVEGPRHDRIALGRVGLAAGPSGGRVVARAADGVERLARQHPAADGEAVAVAVGGDGGVVPRLELLPGEGGERLGDGGRVAARLLEHVGQPAGVERGQGEPRP